MRKHAQLTHAHTDTRTRPARTRRRPPHACSHPVLSTLVYALGVHVCVVSRCLQFGTEHRLRLVAADSAVLLCYSAPCRRFARSARRSHSSVPNKPPCRHLHSGAPPEPMPLAPRRRVTRTDTAVATCGVPRLKGPSMRACATWHPRRPRPCRAPLRCASADCTWRCDPSGTARPS